MDTTMIYVPNVYKTLVVDIKKIPFVKTEDGYQFADWMCDLRDDEKLEEDLDGISKAEEARKAFEDTKRQLNGLVITEEDYIAWSVHKKEAGGVLQYHKILYDFQIELFLLAIDTTAEEIIAQPHLTEATLYTGVNQHVAGECRSILNKNNPFADVTIKSQLFFYKTNDGSVDTLFFDTNNVVEKVDKNDQQMITMRPSFSVTKEHGVIRRPSQKVTFANSIAEPIVGDEEHIYIHID